MVSNILFNRKISSVLLLLLVTGLGSYWTYMNQSIAANEQRLLMNEIVNAQARAIERRLSHTLAATQILALEVQQQQGLIKDFESYAGNVLESVGGISNLQLAPEGVIQKIHPLKGNEKAIGHNILRDDRRQKEAHKAIKERTLTLAGPFELIQGGIAIIGRNPVFLGIGDEEKFWGFTSVLIFLSDLLAVTELDLLESKGYCYQLSRLHPDTDEVDVFSASKEALEGINQSALITVPNATWTLTMSRPTIGTQWLAVLGYLTSIVAGLLAAWMLHYILRQPEKLQHIVNQKTSELETLAYYDHLTGLANRYFLREQLNQVIRQTRRYDNSAALLYLDLDDFKRINDSMGHGAGDQMLMQLSRRLKGIVREVDMVARLGGDEFAILLLDPNSVRDVTHIANRLIEQIELPITLENKEFTISASVGITQIPTDGDDVTTLLRNADMAMYTAKKAGKRNYRFFESKLQAEAINNMRLEEDLIAAIKEQEFVLHYQPLLDLKSNTLYSYEALVRWNHPHHGLTYPDKFIGIAEETGKIIDIGYLVIQQACELIKSREPDMQLCQRIAVNLSPRQFSDPNLLEEIRTIVRNVGIDPQLLEIEVTESTLMESIEDATQTLEQLKEMGIRIAIDDFGTGYSSLAQLKRLPVDKLKIDRSFIKDLDTDHSDQNIVRGLISMAHALGLSVVAEGIETKKQLEILQQYECDYGQGYLFSKPVAKESMEQPMEVSLLSGIG